MSKPMNIEPFMFDCGDEQLIAFLHHAEDQNASDTGIVIVVGGPQYRVGSHRQFYLLAKTLAKHNIPCLRFDYRGMGDSTGALQNFENIEPDIKAAIDHFLEKQTQLKRVVLWGLCDGASAAMMYAAKDKRVAGLVLLNPWVRTTESLSKTYIKTYYKQAFLSRAFWLKLLTGKISVLNSLKDYVKKYFQARLKTRKIGFLDQMLSSMLNFSKPCLYILSEKDLTANEFKFLLEDDPSWSMLIARKNNHLIHVKDADHSFSSEIYREMVEGFTNNWIREHFIKDN